LQQESVHTPDKDIQQQQQQQQQADQHLEQQQAVLQHAPPDANGSQQRHWQMLQRMLAFMVSS
jgi:hypothetical protein